MHTHPRPLSLTTENSGRIKTLNMGSSSLQGMKAVAFLGNLHLDPITDLAWSRDGRFLAVSSRDSYCSIATFSDADLGEPLPESEFPPHLAARMASAQGKQPTR